MKLTKSALATAVLASILMAGSALAAELTVSFGQSNNPGEPHAMAGDYWQKIMAEQSGGTIELIHYPSDQLGSKSDCINQMLMGEAVIAPLNATQFVDLGVADFGIMMAPYLVRSWEDAHTLMESELYKNLEKKLEDVGYHVICHNWEYGVRHTLTKTKVDHPSDLKGMRIRVPDSVPNILMMESLGASATPLVMNEIYPALQQGTIDGLENPLTTILGGHWQEVAKFIVLDGHTYDVNSMVCGKMFWDSLTPEQQELLTKTAIEAGEYQNKVMREQSAAAQATLEADGVTFTEANLEEWAEAAESYYNMPQFKSWTPGLREEVNKILGRE